MLGLVQALDLTLVVALRYIMLSLNSKLHTIHQGMLHPPSKVLAAASQNLSDTTFQLPVSSHTIMLKYVSISHIKFS